MRKAGRKHKNKFLVCAPADALLAIPGSSFTRICSACSGRVMIAPSGQRFLKTNPSTRIICDRCAPLPQGQVKICTDVVSLIAEVKLARSNLFRERN